MKKGRFSPTDYEPSDKVVIQDHLSERWNIHLVITEKCVAEDGTSKTFLLEKNDGKVVLKHAWKTPRKYVNWQIPLSAADRAGLNNV